MPMSNDLTDRSEAILNLYVFKNLTEVREKNKRLNERIQRRTVTWRTE